MEIDKRNREEDLKAIIAILIGVLLFISFSAYVHGEIQYRSGVLDGVINTRNNFFGSVDTAYDNCSNTTCRVYVQYVKAKMLLGEEL